MSFYSRPNRDAPVVAPEMAASGPLEGFFESFSVSVDAQMRTSSQFGIEYFMHGMDWEQTEAMREAGINAPPQLLIALEGLNEETGMSEVQAPVFNEFRSGPYLDVARRMEGEDVGPEFDERLAAYDARILKLREERPDLKLRTSRQMFGEVKRRAQEIERREAEGRRTWGGSFGGFLGGALASLHPQTDPLNFATLGVGAVGRTALTRIGSQGAGQGGIEAVNQLTGVQEQRRLLGLSNGLWDAASRVAMTAAGGGALQGLGEGAAALGRRWFRNTPTDPAPPRSIAAREPEAPLKAPDVPEAARAAVIERDGVSDTLAAKADGGERSLRPAARADLNDVDGQLSAWDGPVPVEMRPTGAIRTPIPIGRLRTPRPPRTSEATASPTQNFDAVASRRAVKAVEEVEAADRAFEFAAARRTDSNPKTTETLAAMEKAADEIASRPNFRFSKEAQAELKEVEADITKLREASKGEEAVGVSKAREQQATARRKRRIAGVANTRVQKRSEGEWDAPPTQAEKPAKPVNREAPKLEPEAVKAELAEIDRASEALLTNAKSLAENDTGKVATGTDGVDLDLDTKLFIGDAEGREITLRQALEEIEAARMELEGVTTCSIR